MSGGQGNGEDKDDKNRKKYRDTKYDFEEENEEESDTEDSFEFEITPQQLSQVTPGGGVLKLTLTKRGPLKITTEAQKKKPDHSQTGGVMCLSLSSSPSMGPSLLILFPLPYLLPYPFLCSQFLFSLGYPI